MSDEKTFKVVAIDNFANEAVADHVVEDDLPKEQADAYCQFLNDHAPPNGPRWHIVREHGARDWRGMEELV